MIDRVLRLSKSYLPAFVMGFCLLFLFPRPGISGFQFVTFFSIIFYFAMVIILLATRRGKIEIKHSAVLYLPLLYMVSASISLGMNHESIRSGGFVELGRPIFLLVAYVFAYSCVSRTTPDRTVRNVANICKFLLVMQLFVAAVQLFYPTFFDLVWSADKTTGLGQILRLTGTMYNPNLFAFAIGVFSTFIVVADSTYKSLVWLTIAGFLVLLSGSRTNMIIWPAVMTIGYGLTKKLTVRTLLQQIALLFFLVTVVIVLLTNFSDTFRYAAQLLDVLTSGNLSSVNAYAARQVMWDRAFKYVDSLGWHACPFGAGASEKLRTVDNDYIYIYVKFGVLGFLVHINAIWHLLKIGWLNRSNVIGRWFICVMMIACIQGLTTESLSGWFIGLVVFLMAGVCNGFSKAQISYC